MKVPTKAAMFTRVALSNGYFLAAANATAAAWLSENGYTSNMIRETAARNLGLGHFTLIK